MKTGSILITVILLISPINSNLAQNKDVVRQQVIEELIENLASTTDEEIDYTTLFNDLNYYADYPLNLNTATYEDLEKLHLLNDFQIKSLQKYIHDNGQLLSLYELSYVFGYTDELIQQILPFVTLETEELPAPITLKKNLKYGRHELLIRSQRILEQQKGYIPLSDSALADNPGKAHYTGSPYKVYSRYRFNYSKRVYAGITAEKDAGEEFFRGSNPGGFDFYSAYLQLNDMGPLKSLIIGDFHVQTGQGLTLWSGLSFGKSSNAIDIRKKAQGIRRNTAADENLFFRGTAATFESGNFEFTGFVSRKKRDANLTDTLDNSKKVYSSLLETGYHSTPAELTDEKQLEETTVGAHITYRSKFIETGITLVNCRFDGLLQPDKQIYNQFDFTGNRLTNFGIDYHTGGEKWQFFGETSYGNGGTGTLAGITLYPHPQAFFSAYYRNYNKRYAALYSSALSESSKNCNEKGLYLGTEIHPYKGWKITAYFDNFKFPWLKYHVSSPSSGNEYFLQINFDPTAAVGMNVRFRRQLKPENTGSGEKLVQSPEDISTKRVRYHIFYSVSENIVMKDRLEWCEIKKENNKISNGWLIYHDINWKFSDCPLSLSFRYAMFDTDDYDARIYAYENDVLNAFSVPAYYYRGTRVYGLLKYEITKSVDIWLRYAMTNYTNQNKIGSGLTEINGNTKSELKVQLRIKL